MGGDGFTGGIGYERFDCSHKKPKTQMVSMLLCAIVEIKRSGGWMKSSSDRRQGRPKRSMGIEVER